MTDKPKTYYIKTFGCQMNEAESEQIAAGYEAREWKRIGNWEKADEIVINSCSVREAAENRVFGFVNNIHQLKAQSLKLKTTSENLKLRRPKIILTGCMVGSALGDWKRYSLRFLKKKMPQVAEFKASWDWNLVKKKIRKPPTGQKKTLVPIMKGCSHFCTFCVVPYAKGKEVSSDFEEIICQIKALVKKGQTGIMLLGQNVNTYGNDFSNKEKIRIRKKYISSLGQTENLFALLLKKINQIKGIQKISFMTSNPWDLVDEIIQTMKLPIIDRYLHLPLQSGDDRILKKMNRPYTANQYLKLVKKIRQEIPRVKITTDIIVGFPMETGRAFKNTVKICKKVGFAKAYIARYSARPGTAAFCLKDDISPQEKRRRWQILDNLIN